LSSKRDAILQKRPIISDMASDASEILAWLIHISDMTLFCKIAL